MITTYKDCTACGLSKELDQFPCDSGYYRNKCKQCRNEERMELYWSRREYELKYMKEYQKAHLDYFAAKMMEYRHRDLDAYNRHIREYRAAKKNK